MVINRRLSDKSGKLEAEGYRKEKRTLEEENGLKVGTIISLV